MHKHVTYTNMKQISNSYSKKEKLLILAILSTFFLIYVYRQTFSNPTNFSQYIPTYYIPQPKNDNEAKCDLFKGRWIRDARGPLYTNNSCSTLPLQRNCFLNGRENVDFLNWRWKPDECELFRFSPQAFLNVVRGKTMAFIGDSLARNQVESLLCLLSTFATPRSLIQTGKEKEDKITSWEFPTHNFTIMSIWSQFFVSAYEQVINGSVDGSFNLTLDKVDPVWSSKLPIIDYAIFSGGHWFPRPHFLYELDNLIGCVYCQYPNMTAFGPGPAIRKAIRTAFAEINKCENCKKIFTIMRTFSPQHFENGAWNQGGRCNRTKLIDREDVNIDGPEWEYRKIQVEEIELARKLGTDNGNKFEILDVTEMMLMRPDGHPDVYWGNIWMMGYSDCVHWCLPGPIDFWNELLLEVVRKG